MKTKFQESEVFNTISKCGICGKRFASLMTLSLHDCNLPLTETCDRAYTKYDHLVGAAPDMLEALKMIVSYGPLLDRLDLATLSFIYKTIDKAQGKK